MHAKKRKTNELQRYFFNIVAAIATAIFFSSCATANTHSKAENSDEKFSCIEWTETAFIPSPEETKIVFSRGEKPLRLKIAVSEPYCAKTACACVHDVAARQYDEIIKKLKDEHNIELELTYFPEPYYMEDKLLAGEFDGAICKPWLAFMLLPGNDIDFVRVADILDPKNNQFLRGQFVALADSEIKNLQGINGKTLVIGNADSYEKHFLAKQVLAKNSISPAKIYEKSSCIEAIGELLDGNADVAAISDYSLQADCAVDIVKPGDLRIIAQTDKIPLTSFLVNTKNVQRQDMLRLQKALLSISGNNTPSTFLGNGFILPSSWIPQPQLK